MDWNGTGPPLNLHEDSICRKNREAMFPRGHYFHAGRKWNARERSSLMKGLKHMHRTYLLDQIMEKHKEALVELERINYLRKRGNLSSEQSQEDSEIFSIANIQTWPRELAELRQEIEQIEHMTLDYTNKDTILCSNLESVEGLQRFMPSLADSAVWEKVSTQFVKTKPPMDCYIQWTWHECPLINHQPWTKEELSQLGKIVEAMQLKSQESQINLDWQHAAIQHGHSRTAIDCLTQYQRHLNKDLLRSRWTPEEDTLLKNVVRYYGTGKWQLVSMHLEGRTGQQCLHRWTRCLRENVAKKKLGKWEPEEDEKLKEAVNCLGTKSWTAISEWVPGRTDVQCRERWTNILDPRLHSTKASPWTIEEDAKLLEVAPRFDFKWSLIASTAMYPRTDNQCARRWKSLQKIPKYKRKQREALEKVLEKRSRNFTSDLSSMPNINIIPPAVVDNTRILRECSGTISSISRQADVPRRRLEQLSKILQISFGPTSVGDSIEESPDDLPLDPYNVNSLLLLWESLAAQTLGESQANSLSVENNFPLMNNAQFMNQFDIESVVLSDDYQLLLKQFKTLYTWPLLLALLPE